MKMNGKLKIIINRWPKITKNGAWEGPGKVPGDHGGSSERLGAVLAPFWIHFCIIFACDFSLWGPAVTPALRAQ